jgi:YhcH/YjgK/YiaL family protein
MIYDQLHNAKLYYGINPRLDTALDFLLNTDFSQIEPGRYELDGEDIYYLIQEYQSKQPEAAKWESHKRYIDIQYIVSGTEQMGYAPIHEMELVQDALEVKDCLYYAGEGSMILAKAGTFAVFFPEDAHRPGVMVGAPEPDKKVVVKIKV